VSHGGLALTSVLASPGQAVADIVGFRRPEHAEKGAGLLVLVAYHARLVKRGAVPGDGVIGLARGEENLAQAVQGLGLAAAVTRLAAQFQGLPEPGGAPRPRPRAHATAADSRDTAVERDDQSGTKSRLCPTFRDGNDMPCPAESDKSTIVGRRTPYQGYFDPRSWPHPR
jgi:hypothetical protein